MGQGSRPRRKAVLMTYVPPIPERLAALHNAAALARAQLDAAAKARDEGLAKAFADIDAANPESAFDNLPPSVREKVMPKPSGSGPLPGDRDLQGRAERHRGRPDAHRRREGDRGRGSVLRPSDREPRPGDGLRPRQERGPRVPLLRRAGAARDDDRGVPGTHLEARRPENAAAERDRARAVVAAAICRFRNSTSPRTPAPSTRNGGRTRVRAPVGASRAGHAEEGPGLHRRRPEGLALDGDRPGADEDDADGPDRRGPRRPRRWRGEAVRPQAEEGARTDGAAAIDFDDLLDKDLAQVFAKALRARARETALGRDPPKFLGYFRRRR